MNLLAMALALATVLDGGGAVLAQRVVTPRDFPLKVLRVDVVGRELAFGQIMGSDIAPDGSVLLIDYSTSQVLKLSPQGKLMWRVGRKGGGPGEYQLPYRVVAMFDGTCVVYDLGTARLSRLDSNGAFVSQSELDMRMLEVDNIVALADGGLAISGVGQPRTAGNFAIHIFDADFRHSRSFGALPPASSLQIQRQWGAGGLSRTHNGELLFTRRLPYEVQRFRVNGDSVGPVAIPFDWRHRAGDVIKITTDGTRTVTSMNPELPQPGRAVSLGREGILGTHTEGKQHFLDLLDINGALQKSMQLPAGWKGVIGYAEGQRILWMSGEVDLEPVLFRLELLPGL